MILHDWFEDLTRARPSVDWQEAGTLVTLDPGETTGWSVFRRGELVACGQEPTPNPAAMATFLRGLLDDLVFADQLVYEEYRVRGNKFNEHVGSEVVTIQNIGAIQVVADDFNGGLPIAKQGAGLAKGFATDTKLRRWGLYQSGKRHSNDAIRHAVYYLMFSHGRKKHGPRHQDAGGAESPD